MKGVRDWLAGLEARERTTLLLGAFALAAMLVYFLIFEPLANRRGQLVERVADQERGLTWMRGAAAELGRDPTAAQRGTITRDDRSLLALVDETVRSHNLANAMRRGEPGAAGDVRLWFEGVSFNRLIDWLVALDANYGVHVTEFSADRAAGTGLVDARVTVRDL